MKKNIKQTDVGQLSKKKTGSLLWPHDESGRTGHTYGKARKRRRQGVVAVRTNDGQPCCVDELDKGNVCYLGNH